MLRAGRGRGSGSGRPFLQEDGSGAAHPYGVFLSGDASGGADTTEEAVDPAAQGLGLTEERDKAIAKSRRWRRAGWLLAGS